MGANKNKNQAGGALPQEGYGPNAGKSGMDPRGRSQNQGQYQQKRHETRIDPMLGQMQKGYGEAVPQAQADYGDIMNRYRNVASGGGDLSYTDPFKSYGGYEEFSKTGGYSPEDVANMRARGTSPVRAAYANAERELGRNRSLQGGYSPNAAASLVKMAREQGQAGADAMQGVEAGLAQQRQQGRLAGLSGMAGIEGQRLGADLDVGRFNKGNQLQALQGMQGMYGTTPGMANMFGQQALAGSGQTDQFGMELMRNEMAGQQLPGQYETTMGKIGDVANMAYPFLDYLDKGRGQQQPQQNQMGGQMPQPPTGGPFGLPSQNSGGQWAQSPPNAFGLPDASMGGQGVMPPPSATQARRR